MISQNKLVNNSDSNLNRGMNTLSKGVNGKSQVSTTFHTTNEMKGFNDYVLESFISYTVQMRDKK